MTNKAEGNGDKPRDEERGQYVPETTDRELIDTLEELGETRVPTTDIREELDYSPAGAISRLEKASEYVEKEDLGNTILWSLKYDRRDIMDAFDALGDLTPPEEIAEHVGCSEEVAREWLYKLKDEGELATQTRGEDISPLWSRMPD